MVFGINLPDWKISLQEALTNYVKTPLETKAEELKKHLESKAQEFKDSNHAFQKTVIAILFASFLVITINFSFPDNKPTM